MTAETTARSSEIKEQYEKYEKFVGRKVFFLFIFLSLVYLASFGYAIEHEEEEII